MKAILTYHSVDETGSVISIDERSFRRHVAWLASSAVRVVPLDTPTGCFPPSREQDMVLRQPHARVQANQGLP